MHATKHDKATIKGKLVEFAWYLKKEGYREKTIETYGNLLKWLRRKGANLYEAETVKDVIARQEHWSDNTKCLAVAAYPLFASVNSVAWKPPAYKPKRKLSFIPLESEIDALIASCGKKTATLLQCLKETAARIGEVTALRWIDVDLECNTVTINAPEKEGNSRIFKISSKLAAMLNALPKQDKRVFGNRSPNNAAVNFRRQRKRAARKLQNPRLNYIHFHTLRHWKATMEYHKTKDILHVMQMLGHKNIKNTLVYT